MDDEILERLETKLAFLEKAASDLSDVVYRQQRDIGALNDKLAALATRVDAMKATEADRPYSAEEERPPHY